MSYWIDSIPIVFNWRINLLPTFFIVPNIGSASASPKIQTSFLPFCCLKMHENFLWEFWNRLMTFQFFLMGNLALVRPLQHRGFEMRNRSLIGRPFARSGISRLSQGWGLVLNHNRPPIFKLFLSAIIYKYSAAFRGWRHVVSVKKKAKRWDFKPALVLWLIFPVIPPVVCRATLEVQPAPSARGAISTAANPSLFLHVTHSGDLS